MVGAVGLVPGVITALPGQRTLKGAEEIVERPGDDDVVVCTHDEGDGYSCHANTSRSKRGKTI